MLCAIYCRLSREDEDKHKDESESIQNQKSILIRYAVEQGWDIFDLYCDEDYSGVDANRPAFKRMLKDAEAKKFKIILCKTQSRFTRDMELVEKYIHGKFLLWGIRFVAIADNVDTDVRGNKKARQINGLINEWYLEDLSENIRMVFDHKRKKGQYIGGFPVYGYKKDPDDKNKLIVDEDAAPIVRQIFDWYLAGNGTQHIARMLNEQGIDNPTVHKQKLGLGNVNASSGPVCNAGLWNKMTVSRILHNEMYCGVMVQGRTKKVSYKSKVKIAMPEAAWYRVEGTHEAIIEPELFRHVQEVLGRHGKSDKTGIYHPLSGLVRCADCGSTMCKATNGANLQYLRCRLSVESGNQRCSRHSIRLDRLIELVTERLREYIIEWYRLGDMERFEQKDRQEGKKALEARIAELKRQIGQRNAALRQLYLDRASGQIDEEQFREFRQDFTEEKETLMQQRDRAASELAKLAVDQDDKQGGLVERIEELLELKNPSREMFQLAVAQIEIGERRRDTGEQAVRIRWRF